MLIPAIMLNDNIKASAEYSEYLAKSKVSAPVKATSRGKCLITKDGVEVAVERVSIPKRRRSKTVVKEVGPTGIVIGGEGHRESDEEEFDQLKKLKGLETLSKAIQFKVTSEVTDELTLKSSNKGAGLILEVPDETSDYSNSSSFDSEFAVKDILSDEDEVTEKADDVKKADVKKDTNEQVAEEHVADKQTGDKEHGDNHGDNEPTGDAQADVQMSETQLEKPEATKVISTLTLSSVEPKVQSMVDVLLTQKNSAEQRPPLVNTTVTVIPDPTTLDNKVTRLEKKVHAISNFNLPDTNDKSDKAHLKNVLPKDIPDFGKIKMDKAKKSMPKHSSTTFDQAALDEFEQKDKLFQMMSKSRSYTKHPAHKALFDALALSLSLDEDDMEKEQEEPPKGEPYFKSSKSNKPIDAEDDVYNVDMDAGEFVKDHVVHAEAPIQVDDNVLAHDKSKWFKEDVVKNPLTFEDVIGSVFGFTNFTNYCLKKNKLMKADLEGPAFNLIKGRHKNYIELE
ncbi:hypothetical protein Tco_1425533 [Tanacetum coccineum]